MNRDATSRLLRAGLLTGVTDGLFACVLALWFYHSTVTRLWQGVASVLLGKSALDGGMTTVLKVASLYGPFMSIGRSAHSEQERKAAV